MEDERALKLATFLEESSPRFWAGIFNCGREEID